MPCYDPRPNYYRSEKDDSCKELEKTERLLARTEAFLCAILRWMDPRDIEVLASTLDWEEAGVTRESFLRWWEEHQKADKARRGAEVSEQSY